MNWTPEQELCIVSRGGARLVSAAAGAGKTAVLVERILRRLLDRETPCLVTELLVVTFTRAAAAQMRERIEAALDRCIQAAPGDPWLLRQQQLLPLAQISTIDQFCFRLVREHGAALGIPPNVRLLDDSECMLLRDEAMTEVLEAAYAAARPAFVRLGLLLEVGGEDGRLRRLLLSAATMALSTPQPERFLSALAARYETMEPPQCTVWGQVILETVRQKLSFCVAQYEDCLHMLEQEPELKPKYSPLFSSEHAELYHLEAQVERLLGVQNENTPEAWDALVRSCREQTFARLPNKPKNASGEAAEACKARRDAVKKLLKEELPKLLCVRAEEALEDAAELRPVAEEVSRLVQSFLRCFSEKKTRRGALDFGDLLHGTLRLLLDETGTRTSLSESLGAGFQEILVDEYQDVNLAQAQLFEALSQEGRNLFFVGDVKQSIYRFRQANPGLFLEKRRAWPRLSPGAPAGNGPSCLLLGKNFRSQEGVTDAVNFTFRQLMRADATEIEYSAEEELLCGTERVSERVCTKFTLLERPPGTEELAAEAAFVAQQIAEEVRSGRRGARDFCILLRSDKRAGAVYAEALKAEGVMSCAPETGSLFRNREIQWLLSFLRIIDNPLQDVPLLAVALSPFVGFTPEVLAELRIAAPEAPGMFQVLCAGELAGHALCVQFLGQLRSYRKQSAVLAPGELLRQIIEDTALEALVGALPQPERRRANLERFEQMTRTFHGNTDGALSGFLRYLTKLEKEEAGKSGGLTSANSGSEQRDAVRIMSIHKSKGLEFPVTILAQCSHTFHFLDEQQPLLLHPELGLGLQRVEEASRCRYQSLPAAALRAQIHRDALSEELRLLYVAMTRAREELWLYASEKSPEQKLKKCATHIQRQEQRLSAGGITGARSFADWLLPVALRHPDGSVFRKAASVPASYVLPATQRWAFQMSSPKPQVVPESEAFVPEATDPALVQELKERLSYRYPYAELHRIAAKRAASELTERELQEAFAFSSRPAFTRTDHIAAAQRGSAMHAFLQFADSSLAAENLTQEISRLRKKGYLTALEEQALERDKLEIFFASAFAKRMLQSPRIYREQKFTLRLPAAAYAPELSPELTAGEELVVQGIIDCAFEEGPNLILVDYKTDRVAGMEELLQRYQAQLQLYRRAMQTCFRRTVAETVLYSFWLGTWIEVPV